MTTLIALTSNKSVNANVPALQMYADVHDRLLGK